MKKLKAHFWPVTIFALFFAMAIACVAPKHYTYQKPKPQPCITHKGLTYSPVLVKFFISGSYTLKDLEGAQQRDPEEIISELNRINPYKYQLSSGQTPNLNLYVTYNTDSYQHYGATITGYVYDGDFSFTLPTNYNIDDLNGSILYPGKIMTDIASKVNAYIAYGWCKNCTGPCNP
jgi:hypothetical protein